MAFKMKGSPMKRNFDVDNSPAKHKMEVDPEAMKWGGSGVTVNVAARHNETYGEGHPDHTKTKEKREYDNRGQKKLGTGLAAAAARKIAEEKKKKTPKDIIKESQVGR